MEDSASYWQNMYDDIADTQLGNELWCCICMQ